MSSSVRTAILLYSYDIATKGKSGIDEVQVDAITGAVIGDVVHENAAKEKGGGQGRSEGEEGDEEARGKG